ncbi:MAG TPA: cellulose-binding protein, partial [Ktedonobacter sp.]|nr:cellulose-binding protein [Ktedonobacter sp.]
PSKATAANASHSSTQNVQVSINANTSNGTVPGTALGMNTAAWDSHMLDASIPNLLQQDGVKVMRFPGGSTSDYYKWQSNTALTCSVCGGVDASDTFDAFMGVTGATGAQAMITVNYGSGTPQEAAGWVQYANKGGSGYTGPVPTYPGGSSTGHN